MIRNVKESTLRRKEKMFTFKLDESKIKLLLSILESTKKENNKELKELELIFKEPNANEEIVEKFILKYKYDKYTQDSQSIMLNNRIYSVKYEKEKMAEFASIEDFIPCYRNFIANMDKYNDASVFKEKEFYIDKLNNFKKSIKNLGILMKEDNPNEYDEYRVFTYFYLPIKNLLDDNFINLFINVLDDYNKNINDELVYIYRH
ncbi:hypothetical protein IR152_10870 [Clostridioides sp. ES-S-0108-01]|uniref:hypothetical protein n=1 Tax=Clostridioides sp. ES-S-0108-01 TaxID=2770773 RepID=UPI001D0CA1C8|nr:hypothetical protein [Clostridioides sp. ES-S-0108-01]